jgi:hypothetical protein
VLNRGSSFDSEWLINGVSAILTSLTHSHFIIAINYTRTSFTQSGKSLNEKTDPNPAPKKFIFLATLIIQQ